MHVLELIHNGRIHRGLQRGSFTLSMEQIAHDFEFRYQEKLEGTEDAWILDARDYVVLKVDGEPVIDGYLDTSEVNESPGELTFDVTGRSTPCDLVDSDYIAHPAQWESARIDAIASRIVRDFGFAIDVDPADVGAPLRRWSVEKNESAFTSLARLVKNRGLVPRYVPGTSTIKLEKLAAEPELRALVVGENVMKLSRKTDTRQLFSEYHFRGTTHATDDTYGSATKIKNVVYDPLMVDAGRYRPKRIEVKGADGPSDFGVRAKLERNRRAGDSEQVTCTVSGWYDFDSAGGKLWAPNQRRVVHAPNQRIEYLPMIITTVKYAWDVIAKEGYVAEITLKRPEAFDYRATYPSSIPGATWR